MILTLAQTEFIQYPIQFIQKSKDVKLVSSSYLNDKLPFIRKEIEAFIIKIQDNTSDSKSFKQLVEDVNHSLSFPGLIRNDEEIVKTIKIELIEVTYLSLLKNNQIQKQRIEEICDFLQDIESLLAFLKSISQEGINNENFKVTEEARSTLDDIILEKIRENDETDVERINDQLEELLSHSKQNRSLKEKIRGKFRNFPF